jgi:tetratricopeptide (TPR) repeat protein
MEELAMAYNLGGVQAYQQRKNSTALSYFQSATYYDKKVALYVTNLRLAQAGVHNDEGVALFSQGNYKAALDKFSAANVENGSEPVYAQNVQYASGMIQNKYGLDQGAAGHYDEAIKAFNQAARYDPARKETYMRNAQVMIAIVTNNRGIAQWNQGDLRGALTSFEQAAAENPADKTYRDNAELARQKMRNGGNAGGGAAITDAAQKANQANAEGVAAEKRGDNLASLHFFEQAVAYGGPDVDVNRNNVKIMKAKVLNDRGLAAYQKGDYLNEVRYYKEAISYGGPNVATFRSNLAGAQARLAAAAVKLSLEITAMNGKVSNDAQAIRNLGFSGRTQEIDSWASLASKSREKLANEVRREATEFVVSSIQDRLTELAFTKLTRANAGAIVERLKKTDPKPLELIHLVNTMARMNRSDRDAMTKMAKALVAELSALIEQRDEKWTWETRFPVILGVCDALFGTEYGHLWTLTNLSLSSVYNNASQRVARANIQRLTALTEQDLRAWNKLNYLLVEHVRKRNSLSRELRSYREAANP